MDPQTLLQGYVHAALADWTAPRVGPVTRITDGWESELYTLDVEHGRDGERRRTGLVLRLYPGDGAARKAQHEFTGMGRLHQAGYPVPVVHRLALDDSPLGQPFILMDRIEGAPLWPGLAEKPPAEQQAGLVLFCELFVRLHRLDWRPFVADPAALEAAGPYALVDHALASARDFVTRFELPGFTPLVDWLAAHRAEAACPRPAVVHRDFHPGNVLVRADGSAVVIDWSGLGVSDPRFDLAWLLVLAHGYVGADLRDELLRGYERAAGETVLNLDYFEAFACARRLGDVTVSLLQGAGRLGMRPEAVALMQAQLPALARVRDRLRERTGVTLPEVERLLAETPSA